MKKLSLLLIVAGLVLLGVGGYQWFHTAQAQKNSLAAAQTLLDEGQKVQTNEGSTETAKEFAPQTGDTAGILYIPRLDAELPIVEGTDEDDLAKGVGHYKGTAYPGQNDQIVLSGHRDTVFRSMGELELGDHLTVKLPYGDFTYEIVDTKIVDADDRTIISPTAPEEVLTLTTCYPFSFVGSAPDRYIITALPVETEKDN
ncbi:class D sortase [Oceanobacillus jordanicus]|uniref:Class D sortase n=1 Tax=Oceanobacillus jordanicus TaxID=2867266 RepID=A0AAW5B860_9BACI|nr:class D sortase [Oceanobacillus jordanicus]MCG3420595.1 class D sortase [Oceanobacillus jordanicus]